MSLISISEPLIQAAAIPKYAQKYNVGDVVMLDLDTEGIVPFELVAKDADELT